MLDSAGYFALRTHAGGRVGPTSRQVQHDTGRPLYAHGGQIMPTIPCNYCGKLFCKRLSRIKKDERSFCSAACYHAAPLLPGDKRLIGRPRSAECRRKIGEANRKHYPDKTCPVCGIVFAVTSMIQHRKTCGQLKCAFKLRSLIYSGKNHYRWRGGTDSHWHREALKTLRAAGVAPVCAWCDADQAAAVGGMHIHHKNRDRTNNVLVNVEWLCGSCHSKLHRRIEWALGFRPGQRQQPVAPAACGSAAR